MKEESDQYINQLQQMNEELIGNGQHLPSIRLADGTLAQTGTMGTLMKNVKIYNETPSEEVVERIKLAIPMLYKLGLFELFPEHEWACENNPGRTLVGQLATQYCQKKEASE